MFTRSSQAELLNSGAPVTTTLTSCLLNIGVCPAVTDPPPAPPADPAPVDPNAPPSTDITKPAVALNDPSPALAGGNTQTVTLTGMVSDDNLASYSLALNGNVIQQGSDMTEKMVAINVPWSVSTPFIVPSGDYVVTLDATDKAGNTSHDEKTVVVDNDGPTVTLTGGDTIIQGGSISPTTTADDPHGIATYAWTAGDKNPATLTFDVAAPEPTFTPSIEGSYTFYFTVTDGLGNTTTKPFTFGYAQELAPVPLPTTQDPTDALVDQTPSTPLITPTRPHPTLQSGQDAPLTNNDSGVLGSTASGLGDLTPAKTIATIAPTGSGWSIFGVLWYWWLVIAGIIFVATFLIKRQIVAGRGVTAA
ncbi:MAG TPA: Ig-like domain repeat protein [Candidatus Microsaccharimonas sp.]